MAKTPRIIITEEYREEVRNKYADALNNFVSKISAWTSISPLEFTTYNRKSRPARARHILSAALYYTVANITLFEVAALVGLKEHTGAMWGITKATDQFKIKNKYYRAALMKLFPAKVSTYFDQERLFELKSKRIKSSNRTYKTDRRYVV